MEKYDHNYSLGLLKRINNLSLESRPLFAHFNYEGVSLWSFQQFPLWNDVKLFTKAEGDFKKFTKLSHKPTSGDIIFTFIFRLLNLAVTTFFIIRIIFSRVKILCYSPDKLKEGTRKDPRLFEIYRILNKFKIPYGEIIHTLLDREFITNLFQRRRSVFYVECLSLLNIFLPKQKEVSKLLLLAKGNLSQFNEEEKRFILFVLKKYAIRCINSRLEVKLLCKFFRYTGIKIFLSLDDFRYYHELLLAAKLSGITSYVFQHSNFDYLLGLDTLPPASYIFPDEFFLRNDYWINRIQEVSPLFSFFKDRLAIGGRSGGLSKIKNPLPTDADEYLTVLYPYEVNLKKEEIYDYAERVIGCPETKFIFKVRPDMNVEKQIEESRFGSLIKEGKMTVKKVLEDKDIKSIDLVIGVYSGFLDEMVEQEKPVAILQTSYVTFNDLAKGGLAGIVDIHSPDFCGQLLRAASIDRVILKERREKFIKNNGDIEKTIVTILKKQRFL